VEQPIGTIMATDTQARSRKPSYSAEIHQATGIVLAQTGLSADDALLLLLHFADDNEVSLEAVAAGVITRSVTLT
jgi:AmiR/NasT family two-component response regulator